MMFPTLYVCQQVEESRRADERRESSLWRLLHPASKPRRRSKVLKEPSAVRTTWAKDLLGNPGL